MSNISSFRILFVPVRWGSLGLVPLGSFSFSFSFSSSFSSLSVTAIYLSTYLSIYLFISISIYIYTHIYIYIHTHVTFFSAGLCSSIQQRVSSSIPSACQARKNTEQWTTRHRITALQDMPLTSTFYTGPDGIGKEPPQKKGKSLNKEKFQEKKKLVPWRTAGFVTTSFSCWRWRRHDSAEEWPWSPGKPLAAPASFSWLRIWVAVIVQNQGLRVDVFSGFCSSKIVPVTWAFQVPQEWVLNW